MPREASEKVRLQAQPSEECAGGLTWKPILLQKILGNSFILYFFAFSGDRK